MKLLFLGSGAFGLPTIQALHAGHALQAVITQPDRPAGRKQRLTPTPIGQWALDQGVPLLRFEDVNAPEAVAQIRSLGAEAAVVIAFGQKLSPELIAGLGTLAINLHGSLLPGYRGAAPIQRALMHGETQAGVSVIGLAQRMDAGPVYGESRLAIDPLETAGELHDRLAGLGPAAIERVLADLAAGTLAPVVQDEARATRAPKLHKRDGTTDFDQPAAVIRARIHGLTPWPGCRVAWLREGHAPRPLFLRRVRDRTHPDVAPPGTLLSDGCVATAEGVLELLELQVPGGRSLARAAFEQGQPLQPGDRFEPWSEQDTETGA